LPDLDCTISCQPISRLERLIACALQLLTGLKQINTHLDNNWRWILSIFSLIWNWWSGPGEVKIANNNASKRDTVITILKFEAAQYPDEND